MWTSSIDVGRFMICCDRCEEWYHGDCVGISRKRGKQMETQNEEYICSQCKGMCNTATNFQIHFRY